MPSSIGRDRRATVIAVNKDKKAPIFRAVDYGAVADALDIVTALKTELRKN